MSAVLCSGGKYWVPLIAWLLRVIRAFILLDFWIHRSPAALLLRATH